MSDWINTSDLNRDELFKLAAGMPEVRALIEAAESAQSFIYTVRESFPQHAPLLDKLSDALSPFEEGNK